MYPRTCDYCGKSFEIKVDREANCCKAASCLKARQRQYSNASYAKVGKTKNFKLKALVTDVFALYERELITSEVLKKLVLEAL